ncbi:MAG: ABC transporter ATP-binding protein [Candidatus Aenigmarchaeota archaeon]|nr:ABC transporter ATP-binding protein [Candidatus Aenigmarchaeota archaeon]
MKPVIELKDVWKKYKVEKEDVVILREINLEVKKGDFLVIIGPSGSGKSTLMHIMGLLDEPSLGKVIIDGLDATKMNENKKAEFRGKKMGFVFQQFNLIPTMSALENVKLPMDIINISEKEAKERARELLSLVGLENRLNYKPNKLSGGQQQRVAIARALANEPDIILADEPTGNLDSSSGKFVMDFLKKINKQGKTIILVTHELSLVNYASCIIHVKDGKIIKGG